MTGSVIVTTPHPLAVVDVLKGRQMMESMHVPTLALVSLTKLYVMKLSHSIHPCIQILFYVRTGGKHEPFYM
jgi:Mrp family chromosome partitioning ATPase